MGIEGRGAHGTGTGGVGVETQLEERAGRAKPPIHLIASPWKPREQAGRPADSTALGRRERRPLLLAWTGVKPRFLLPNTLPHKQACGSP